jgi:LacI family transcriptional regulator
MSEQVHVMRADGSGSGDEVVRSVGRPTMKDVASRAGVALKTVSRVVNGEPGVTPETARRVLSAIADLGFRRNESARLLRTGRTATLGFIADTWADPDHAAIYQGLEDVARQHGYLLYSGSTGSDPGREERLALAMCARRVDGLIIIPTPGSHDYLVSEIEAGVATVFALRAPEFVRADAVLPDERGAGRTAVAHLVTHGHRRIGLLAGDPGGHRSRRLTAGYAEGMAAAGLPVDPAWLTLTASHLAGAELTKNNLAWGDRAGAGQQGAPVTAVLCADQRLTVAALHVLAASPPPRLAIIGFGDFDLADMISPPVTVASYDPALLGRTAAELLVRRVAGETVPPRQVEVPVRLIPRGSAEFPPQ